MQFNYILATVRCFKLVRIHAKVAGRSSKPGLCSKSIRESDCKRLTTSGTTFHREEKFKAVDKNEKKTREQGWRCLEDAGEEWSVGNRLQKQKESRRNTDNLNGCLFGAGLTPVKWLCSSRRVFRLMRDTKPSGTGPSILFCDASKWCMCFNWDLINTS